MRAAPLLALVALAAAHVSDEEFSSLPRLYQLDDYESCLAEPSGLYCLGTLQLLPQRTAAYSLLEEYSKDPLHFNHTLLHRGYCVSARCPSPSALPSTSPSPEPNATRHFERCAQQWAHARGLDVALHTLHYCRSHNGVIQGSNLDPPQLVFLVVVGVMLVLNMAGTAYDVVVGDDVKKNQLLLSWSLRQNWRRLTRDKDPADPRLAALRPLQGVRVVVLASVIWTHAGFVHHVLFVNSPRSLEHVMSSWMMMLVKNGTALVQVFVLLSSFLLGHQLMRAPPTALLLPKTLLFRYIRLAPVHLLVVGFAATWWGELRDGPVWPLAVREEAAACRRKWWQHALYINNLVQPEDQCLVQTWYLAVDMQLHIFAAVLLLLLRRWRLPMGPILLVLFFGACALNGGLAYLYHWKTMMFIMTPENLRTMFRHEPSFWWFYTAPWGSLPACLAGLLLSHLYHILDEKGLQVRDYKWVRVLFHLFFPLALSWVFSGLLLPAPSPLLAAVHVALERPVLTVLAAVFIFGLCNNIEGIERDFFAWRGWRVLGRLSLPALMLHWCVNMLLAAARPLPLATAPLDVVCDFVSTWVVTYLLATPVSLLVEFPIQRTAAALLA